MQIAHQRIRAVIALLGPGTVAVTAGVIGQCVVSGLGEAQRRPRPGVTGLPAAVQQNHWRIAGIARRFGGEWLAVAALKLDIAKGQGCR